MITKITKSPAIDPDAEVAREHPPVRIAKPRVATKAQNPVLDPPEEVEESDKSKEDGHHEDRLAKFKRVASVRVKAVLKAIRLLGNCSSNAYEFTPAQVERILEVLRKAVEDLGESFNPVQDDSEEFHFDE
jgi:hypothetical protein